MLRIFAGTMSLLLVIATVTSCGAEGRALNPSAASYFSSWNNYDAGMNEATDAYWVLAEAAALLNELGCRSIAEVSGPAVRVVVWGENDRSVLVFATEMSIKTVEALLGESVQPNLAVPAPEGFGFSRYLVEWRLANGESKGVILGERQGREITSALIDDR